MCCIASFYFIIVDMKASLVIEDIFDCDPKYFHAADISVRLIFDLKCMTLYQLPEKIWSLRSIIMNSNPRASNSLTVGSEKYLRSNMFGSGGIDEKRNMYHTTYPPFIIRLLFWKNQYIQ